MNNEIIEKATERIMLENLKIFAIAFAFYCGEKARGTFGELYDRWLREDGKDYMGMVLK